MEKRKTLKNLLRQLAPAGAALALWAAFPGQIRLALQLVLGGGMVAFLLEPLVNRFSLGMKEKTAVFLSLGCWAAGLAAVLLLLAPPIIRQLGQLAQEIPRWMARAELFLENISTRLEAMGFPPIRAKNVNLDWLMDSAPRLLSGTASMAGGAAQWLMQLGLSVMLGVYFLLDRRQMGIRMELMLPLPVRDVVLRMMAEVKGALRTYLRGQATVALLVGALAGLGLWAVGIRSPLALGAIVGILNLVPYFGPILGGVPAVIAGLSQGVWTGVLAAAVLFLVQQADGLIISPRVMSGVTGISPALVLVALTVGGSAWGVGGMFFAIPLLLIVRICFRVWASRNEVIEKPSGM